MQQKCLKEREKKRAFNGKRNLRGFLLDFPSKSQLDKKKVIYDIYEQILMLV